MREEPKPGEFYRHFKNKLYQIVAVAIHSETREKLVIYQALYGEYGVYARPMDMFMSEVDKEKYPDVKQKYRFERIKDIAKESKSDKASDSDVVEQDKKLKEDSVSNENTLKSDKDADFGKGYFIEFLEADDLSTKKEILIANRELISERELDTIYEIYGLKRRKIDRDLDIADLIGYFDMQQQYEGKRLRK
ncbi:MAG: DUF1653 domain-containing protein [Lachnospiraceae bacterium oral taxon 082]|nr:DUF1653 domain-containing protein [Lachnospiraceae bacterium oral taxon 082]